MLRNCKVHVVALQLKYVYNEVIEIKEDFIMILSDKILSLRKKHGMSQEDLAGKRVNFLE